ncbi:MAG: molybdenum cofactor guanylyltransferase [Alphaproteobacteria bacterium]|nr:molybdenum cofactor guanylyltransferase [Alphaproteobacteria bacterium]
MAEDVRAAGGILGLVFAGGSSRRFGSDKALAVLGGTTLIERVIARATPQVDLLALNGPAHRAARGLLVIPDEAPGEGPLGSILAGLRWARSHGFDMVATFPCDAPFFPHDLVARLRQARGDGVDCTMARHGGDTQFAFALFVVTCADRLTAAYAVGERSLKAMRNVLRCGYADFSDCDDGPGGDAFFNINQPDDLAAAERWLDRSRP